MKLLRTYKSMEKTESVPIRVPIPESIAVPASANGKAKKILTLEELKKLRESRPESRICHCHGVFDVLHAGHLSHFDSAKKFGNTLVVTVTGDAYVNKGPGRPYFPEKVRANMVAALEVVDYVAVSPFPTAVPMIEILRPHFYVKGPDYKDKTKDVTGAIYMEETTVEKCGGRLVFTDDPAFSASTIINKFFINWTEDQQHTIEEVLKAGGLAVIERVLDRIAREKVAIIGEPIVDTYVFCVPESLSSKSPSISAKFLYEENYAGGSLAIANHLVDFVNEVGLYFTHGEEAYFLALLKTRLHSKVRLSSQTIPNIPTPRKTRYIAVDKSQRVFELTHLRSDQWLHESPREFCDVIRNAARKTDIAILADFGHGLFEGEVLETIRGFPCFVGLNVQTNSSNFGFNPFTKHKKFSLLSLDTKEARLAYHDRFTSPLELASHIHQDLHSVGAALTMTVGPNGSYFFPAGKPNFYFAPTFTESVVDPTGAGDAFFALTTLLVKVGCPEVMIPFLGNVFAGLQTKIMGNQSSITKAQFFKAVTAILK